MRIVVSRNLLPRWPVLAAAVLAGVIAGGVFDRAALPGTGIERMSAVFLVDGQSYFGHLEDLPWSDTVTLRDVYYLQSTVANAPLVLVRRGTEVHVPADGMRIKRERILLVERMRIDSPAGRAIAVDRTMTANLAAR